MGLGGEMRGREGKVEEEWLFLVGLNELDRFAGETLGQSTVVEWIGDQFPAPPQFLRLVVALVDVIGRVEACFMG